MKPLNFLAVLVLMSPIVAAAQSMAYMDADTPSEAVGMFKTTITAADALLKSCGSRFPELRVEMTVNWEKWRAKDSQLLSKAEYHWARMEQRQPSLGAQVTFVSSAAIKNLENLAAAPGEAGSKVASLYCKQHFVDLASGVWRSRTPRAYAYMESAP